MRKLVTMITLVFLVYVQFAMPIDKTYATTTNSITYQGTLPSYQNHTYRFAISIGGTLNVDFLNDNEVLYFINNVNGEGEGGYRSGENLPAGEYEITFSTRSNLSTNYQVKLSGDIEISSGDVKLPSLSIASPATPFTRLNKGIFNISYSGNSNGTTMKYALNKNLPLSLPTGSFSKNLSVLFGKNSIRTHAELPNKNYITDVREVVSPGVKRISGIDRYSTAVSVSREIENEGFQIDTVIITQATSSALPAVVLAHKETAPILTSHTDYLPSVTKNEINRLGASKAIIIGGQASISAAVESDLSKMGLTVERISGLDRFETTVNIANRVVDEHSNSAVIVNGWSYPGALLAAPYAGNTQKPILYSQPDHLPASVKSFLSEHPNIENFTIIGGSLTDELENELKSYGSTFRVGGATRDEVAINLGYALNFHKKRIVLTGSEIDSIPGALLASFKDAQVMETTNSSTLSSVNQGYISGLGNEGFLENIYIIGGASVISESIEDFIYNSIQ